MSGQGDCCMQRKILWVAALLSALVTCAVCRAAAEEAQWPDIRDGVVFLRMKAGDAATVSSREIWGADGRQDRLYFQAPDGELLTRIVLRPGENGGRHASRLTAARGDGDYRLEVTGLSQRASSLSFSPDIPSVFEPAKVHFSIMNGAAGGTLFFRVPAGVAEFTFRVRAERGGCNSYTLLSPGGKRYDLHARSDIHYSAREHHGLRFFGDKLERGVWRLELNQPGKAAFWLDGIPNLFARRAEHLFVPRLLEARVGVTLTDTVLGKTPLLGVGTEAHVLSPHYEQTLAALGPEFIQYYFFPGKRDQADFPQRGRAAPFPCREEYVILSPLKGHDMLAETEAERGLRELRERPSARHSGLYVSFFDEPNLRFTLENYVRRLTTLRAVLTRDDTNALFMAPESAMFMDGPLLSTNAGRKGDAWTDALYARGLMSAGSAPDMVAWHEWMHRDLLGTDYYADVVNHAAERFARQGQAPLLAVTQTNISSGSDTSAYEQDSFFASLWLAAAFAHAAQTGKLHAFGWFMFSDELRLHQKGLFALSPDAAAVRNVGDIRLAPKPVYHAFRLLLDNKLPQVVGLRGGHADLAMLATADAPGRRFALFVANTAARAIVLSLRLEMEAASGRADAELLTLQEGDTAPRRTRPGALDAIPLSPRSVNVLLLRPAGG